ncbi:MAG: T9SS type A sorting domain-containing protein [Chitinophagales bacterium]
MIKDEGNDEKGQQNDETQAPHERIVLYPNPADDLIHVDLSNSQFPINSISIYNSIGSLCEYIEIPSGTVTLDINISQFTEGLYYGIFKQNNNLIDNKKIAIVK